VRPRAHEIADAVYGAKLIAFFPHDSDLRRDCRTYSPIDRGLSVHRRATGILPQITYHRVGHSIARRCRSDRRCGPAPSDQPKRVVKELISSAKQAIKATEQGKPTHAALARHRDAVLMSCLQKPPTTVLRRCLADTARVALLSIPGAAVFGLVQRHHADRDILWFELRAARQLRTRLHHLADLAGRTH